MSEKKEQIKEKAQQIVTPLATARKSLRERAAELSAAQLPIMANRTKGETEELIGVIVTVRDYGFLTGKNGQYGVFIVDEEPETFYFAGQVLTDDFQKLDDTGDHAAVVNEGLPMILSKRKAKESKQTYVSPLFYPGE